MQEITYAEAIAALVCGKTIVHEDGEEFTIRDGKVTNQEWQVVELPVDLSGLRKWTTKVRKIRYISFVAALSCIRNKSFVRYTGDGTIYCLCEGDSRIFTYDYGTDSYLLAVLKATDINAEEWYICDCMGNALEFQ